VAPLAVSKFVERDGSQAAPSAATGPAGPIQEAAMIRQLFANAGGVPETGRATGAAPFSLALHAVAIGAVLLFAQQKA
jgi:hypothetical protein